MAGTDAGARIAQLESELANLRREMQDFTYVVGHDLRAPLRHIVSFAQLVQEDAGPQLSPEVQGFLGTITDSAHHLSRMLDALLALSRVGTSPMELVQVSLQTLVNEVVGMLQTTHPSRTIAWRIADDLPLVTADSTLLRGVLEQLLDNAVKFTTKKAAAEISVRASHAAGRWTLEISDNGAGFNPSLQAKLMQPFQRLHHPRDFAGIGIGLALARKSVERMGGAVSVSGVEHEGCTVLIQLPD